MLLFGDPVQRSPVTTLEHLGRYVKTHDVGQNRTSDSIYVRDGPLSRQLRIRAEDVYVQNPAIDSLIASTSSLTFVLL